LKSSRSDFDFKGVWAALVPASPVLLGGLCFLATLVFWNSFRSYAQSVDDRRFLDEIQRVQEALKERIRLHERTLSALGGLYEINPNLSEAQHNQFSAEITNISISGISPSPRQPQLREVFDNREGDLRNPEINDLWLLGYAPYYRTLPPDFPIRPPGVRPFYVPTLRFYAPDLGRGDRLQVGYDMASNVTRRAAMEESITFGRTSITARVILQGPQLPNTSGIIMYHPVFRQGMPTKTEAERKAAIQGFTYAPFRVTEFFDRVLSSSARQYISITVIDLLDQAGTVLYQASIPADEQARTRTFDTQILHRNWRIEYRASDALESVDTVRFAPAILAVGTAFSFLLGLFIQELVRRSRQVSEQANELLATSDALEQAKQDLERKVADRTRDLKASNQELEAFVYSVSHDLRSPLRSIDGFSQAILEDEGEKIQADTADHLARIRAAGKRMDGLINSLLTLSRITRSEITPVPIDLSAMVRECADEIVSGMANPPEVVVQPELACSADPRMMRIVLDNLLGNAVKFSSRAKNPRVEFGYDRVRGAFFVKDNGVGFDERYYDKLFKPFERLHSGPDFPGTGIGLATVQRIIARHAGMIEAKSQPGEGATFYFSIPD
jgi:signal transduction histidine kinase